MSLIGAEVSGYHFNELYGNGEFYKITNENENHFGLQYVTGLNIDPNPFNPSGSCQKGGIYFVEVHDIPNFLHLGIYLRKTTIPDDARVYIEVGKFKADKLDLDDRFLIKNLAHWNLTDYCEKAVHKNGLALKFVVKQTIQICEMAVRSNGLALEFVEDKFKTESICLAAVKENGWALEFVPKNFSNIIMDKLNKIAVRSNGTIIRFIKNPSYEICEIAVRSNGLAIKDVEIQTQYLCKLAVTQNYRAIEHVLNQTMELCELAVSIHPHAMYYLRHIPPKFWRTVYVEDCETCRKIKNHDEISEIMLNLPHVINLQNDNTINNFFKKPKFFH